MKFKKTPKNKYLNKLYWKYFGLGHYFRRAIPYKFWCFHKCLSFPFCIEHEKPDTYVLDFLDVDKYEIEKKSGDIHITLIGKCRISPSKTRQEKTVIVFPGEQ